ncbi:MAG TPA: alpha/beta fold hydrolase [Marmoricola sp.]|nr:alpha/beta fold hydrolase [Marmoricola sp.]
MPERDLDLDDGRTLRVHDTATGGRLPVFWHHGTPNVGPPPAPLFELSERLGLHWVGHDRPGYGGSTPQPGRSVGSVAADAAAVADALGFDHFAVVGHSGGGPHALACAALLRDRVSAVVCIAGLAPRDAAGLDWYAGMGSADVASLRAAEAGRQARLAHEDMTGTADDPPLPADERALAGPWGWLRSVTGPDAGAGLDGLVDDEVAFVTAWGFDPAGIAAPVLLLHGADDPVVPSTHSRWLARRCPTAELWIRPSEGHVSVLEGAGTALEWLVSAWPDGSQMSGTGG